MATRIEYLDDPAAPAANSLVPAASAVVVNDRAEILLQQRSDNGLWSIPGGKMEPGETIADCCRRETREETGIDVEVVAVVGIYSNPRHVVAYADGEVRQEFSVCFRCRPVGGTIATSDESTHVAWMPADQLAALTIHPAIRRRIDDGLAQRTAPTIA